MMKAAAKRGDRYPNICWQVLDVCRNSPTIVTALRRGDVISPKKNMIVEEMAPKPVCNTLAVCALIHFEDQDKET